MASTRQHARAHGSQHVGVLNDLCTRACRPAAGVSRQGTRPPSVGDPPAEYIRPVLVDCTMPPADAGVPITNALRQIDAP